MKQKLIFLMNLIAVSALAEASIVDPVADFKTGLTIPAGDKILRWKFDVNGDGKNEVFLSLKSDVTEDSEDGEPAAWVMYVAEAQDYSKPNGVDQDPNNDAISRILLSIDPNLCFIGQITELGRRGIVTMRIKNPRSGPPRAIVYAYTIEGNHLEKHILAEFDATGENAIFDKYLADEKKTSIVITELQP